MSYRKAWIVWLGFLALLSIVTRPDLASVCFDKLSALLRLQPQSSAPVASGQNTSEAYQTEMKATGVALEAAKDAKYSGAF